MIKALLAPLCLALDPAFTETLEVYHVNPAHYGPAPVNMDTADLGGDAFFDLRSVGEPLECANQDPNRPSPDCTNPEVVAHDLVITKLVLEVDSRFGTYGMCNVCVNGSASMSGHCTTEQEGQYLCSCRGFGPHPGGSKYECMNKRCYQSYHGTLNETECFKTCTNASDADVARVSFNNAMFERSAGYNQPPMPSEECNATVGRENVTEKFARMGGCRTGEKNYQCWQANVIQKVGGMWYSTTDTGYCGNGTTPEPSNCTWRVKQVTKIVNKTCSDNSIFTKIEKYDATVPGGGCFANMTCAVGAARNTSSECWISCFYETLLGPDADKPGGTIAGWPTDQLLGAWQQPFLSNEEADGGCPGL